MLAPGGEEGEGPGSPGPGTGGSGGPGNYTISIVRLDLLGVAGHDFYVLKDSSGNVLRELDGQATAADGTSPKAIGYLPSDKLKVFDYARREYYDTSNSQVQKVLATGSLSQMMNLWDAAHQAAVGINNLDLGYPFLGLGANSNSVAATLARAMGLQNPDLDWKIVPGKTTLLLDPNTIIAIQNQHSINGGTSFGPSIISVSVDGNGASTIISTSPGYSTQVSYIDSIGAALGTFDPGGYPISMQTINNYMNPGATTWISGEGIFSGMSNTRVYMDEYAKSIILGSNNVVEGQGNNRIGVIGSNNSIATTQSEVDVDPDADNTEVIGYNNSINLSSVPYYPNYSTQIQRSSPALDGSDTAQNSGPPTTESIALMTQRLTQAMASFNSSTSVLSSHNQFSGNDSAMASGIVSPRSGIALA